MLSCQNKGIIIIIIVIIIILLPSDIDFLMHRMFIQNNIISQTTCTDIASGDYRKDTFAGSLGLCVLGNGFGTTSDSLQYILGTVQDF